MLTKYYSLCSTLGRARDVFNTYYTTVVADQPGTNINTYGSASSSNISPPIPVSESDLLLHARQQTVRARVTAPPIQAVALTAFCFSDEGITGQQSSAGKIRELEGS